MEDRGTVPRQGQGQERVPVVEFRQECRTFAEQWVDIQREEFKRLGVLGEWENPYLTMSFDAEAQIARELMKVATRPALSRLQARLWSVVERTALAEAEIEYAAYESDTIWVKFPVSQLGGVEPAAGSQDRPALCRDLDDDALDHPGQPRHLVFEQDCLRPLSRHCGCGGQLGGCW